MNRMVVGATLCLLLGCERLQQAIEETAREEIGSSPKLDLGSHDEDEGLLEEEKLARKLDLYIVCIDRSRARIQGSWVRYADDIDPDTGMPRRKTGQPFLHAIDKELDPCEEAQERGKTLTPPMPEIEAALTTYLETSKRFAELSRTLHAYYEAEAYEADEWAKGKEIAPEIATAHTAWDAAAEAFASAVSEKRDEVEASLLALVETREGKSLRWHANNLVIEAKKFRICMEQPESTPKECQPAFDALNEAHEAFRAHHDAHEAEAAKVFWMLAYEATADEYVQTASSLMAAFAKSKPKARTEAVESLARLHDDLASDHANLKFDFP